MFIKRISLCQNETENYCTIPRNLNSEYNPLYDFSYPFSNKIFLDCERIVYKLKEYGLESDLCWHLCVTFINDNSFNSPQLMDLIVFNQKKMRFVNIFEESTVFNSLDNTEKRQKIIMHLAEALILVIDNGKKTMIEQICNEVCFLEDNTECLLLNKSIKGYTYEVKFQSSIEGYTTFLYITNNNNNEKSKYVVFKNGSYSDIIYRINKLSIKGDKCVIIPNCKDGYEDAEPIEFNLK